MSSFHHQKNSSSHPPLPKMPPNTTTVRLRVGFCDELFRDCIHHSPNTDTSKYYEDARNQLNLWAKAVMVFNNTWLEPTLDIWLRHSSRKLQRDALDILLIGLEELLLYAVKPFYTSDKLPESRALSILKAPQSGIKKIMGSLHFFADRVIAQRKYEATFNDRVCNFKLEMMDRKTEVDIHRDILDRFPKILPSEPLTSVVGAIYEAVPEYLRRVRDEVTKNTGNLHRHLADLISFQHCRMLYQRHVKVRHLTMLPRHSGPFQPWSNFHGSYTPSISHLQHVLEIVHGGNDQYPKPPIPNDEGKPGVCPLCLETFPMAELQGEKWKAHVDSDIRPYACPFSSCVEDHRASFSDINEWKKHMHRLHDLDWIRDLHRNPLWKCPICHLVSPREFGTAEIATEDLEIHMEVSHSIGEGNPKRVLAQISRFSTHRPLDICPICKTCYPGVGDVPPLFKSSEAMIEREHWSDDEDSEPNYIWRETLAADNPATKAVEECIAGHLKDMALRSFKYFVEAANQQNTELYWLSSPPRIRPWGERLFREYACPTHVSGMPCVLLDPEFVEKQRRLLLLEPKKDSKSYPLLSAG